MAGNLRGAKFVLRGPVGVLRTTRLEKNMKTVKLCVTILIPLVFGSLVGCSVAISTTRCRGCMRPTRWIR